MEANVGGADRIVRIVVGLALISLLFLLEVVTGTLLAFYYQPTAATAFGSTQTIVRDVPFGWFIHQLHAWGAWMLVAIVVVRLVRLFWDGLYQVQFQTESLRIAWLKEWRQVVEQKLDD